MTSLMWSKIRVKRTHPLCPYQATHTVGILILALLPTNAKPLFSDCIFFCGLFSSPTTRKSHDLNKTGLCWWHLETLITVRENHFRQHGWVSPSSSYANEQPKGHWVQKDVHACVFVCGQCSAARKHSGKTVVTVGLMRLSRSLTLCPSLSCSSCASVVSGSDQLAYCSRVRISYFDRYLNKFSQYYMCYLSIYHNLFAIEKWSNRKCNVNS